jgi:hypothetical protein
MADINTAPSLAHEQSQESDASLFAWAVAMLTTSSVELGVSSPTSPALPAAGALRGDIPLSRTEGTEV